ncbi:urease accessory protein UreD [Hymenobacter properus]|uniref:Urease accessory protein UreD n=1 Tax=Hymenobacter properus TaxID=2791026 RepID=A0A931BET4_9BACT|nr:urease accessory protein UreD [Hymenobacter properus]MBF9142099.1 urease accessory protein UreD [Hymenobacter properus]MBR7720906.1 urease accessory protein UreD [Microvirga sp. SRT04]
MTVDSATSPLSLALPSPAAPAWSVLDVAEVRGRSRLVACQNIQPLKLLQPASHGRAAHVVLSSYGGGLVAGDIIRLRVSVQAEARLIISTQASTRVFRSIDGAVAEQHTVGELAENALAVVFPDPVVPQAASRYRQVQEWQLHPSSLLVLVDWFHSGRMDQGERFAFTSLHSELRVRVGGRLVLLDRFAFQPEDHIAASPANFAGYQTFFSVFVVGSAHDARVQLLAELLTRQQMPGSTEPHFTLAGQEFMVSVTRARENVWVLRAAAHSRLALQPLCDALLAGLANEWLLGYNPLARKY